MAAKTVLNYLDQRQRHTQDDRNNKAWHSSCCLLLQV